MKKNIRQEILSIRTKMTQSEIGEKSQKIFEKLTSLQTFIDAKNIFTYLDFKNEVETKHIIDYSISNHKNVFIPYCMPETKEMLICRFTAWEDLSQGTYGILEPYHSKIYIGNRNALDLALIPGAAFDRAGNRIGYGAGYYDKFFNKMSKDICKLALAFAFQVVDKIPKGAYDIPMDYILTEKELININQNNNL